jgi:hypothetical protein
MTGVGEMTRSLVFTVTARGSNGGRYSVNSEGKVTRWQIHSLICAVLWDLQINFMHSCSRQVSEFSYFIRIICIPHVYSGSNEKLVCWWCWVGRYEIFSAVFFPSMFVRCRWVHHLFYPFTRDGWSRREDTWWRCFSLVSEEGETMRAKQLIIMNVILSVFWKLPFKFYSSCTYYSGSCH